MLKTAIISLILIPALLPAGLHPSGVGLALAGPDLLVQRPLEPFVESRLGAGGWIGVQAALVSSTSFDPGRRRGLELWSMGFGESSGVMCLSPVSSRRLKVHGKAGRTHRPCALRVNCGSAAAVTGS